jgi:hypothetical protein
MGSLISNREFRNLKRQEKTMNALNRNTSRWATAALLISALSGLASAQTVPLAKQRTETINGKQYMLTSKLEKILVGNFFYNFNHTTATTNLENTIRRIGGAEGWTVDTVRNGANVTAAKLTDYQVFFANYISSWASGTGFPTANRTAVQNFVENQGGGVFVMHSSGDSRSSNNWAWYYSTLMPITYTGESSRTNVSAKVGINPAAKTHPIMEGIGFGASGTEDSVVWSQGEWHTFNAKIATKVADKNLLLKMNPASCIQTVNTVENPYCGASASTYGTAAEGYPATWTFPAGKGSVGYFMEGHDLVTMQAMGQTTWDRFFKQFMYYIAGYDTVEVPTAIGRPGAGSYQFDRSGVAFSANHPSVLISTRGAHTVALYDLSGKVFKQMSGRRAPVSYDFTSFLPKSKRGIYVMKVSVGKKTMSRRYIF